MGWMYRQGAMFNVASYEYIITKISTMLTISNWSRWFCSW